MVSLVWEHYLTVMSCKNYTSYKSLSFIIRFTRLDFTCYIYQGERPTSERQSSMDQSQCSANGMHVSKSMHMCSGRNQMHDTVEC